MDHITSMISVFCLIDDFLKGRLLRQRGPQPILQDSEVVTMEIVDEFLGIDTDSSVFHYFRRYYGDWFPALRRFYTTAFVRQASSLWRVKQLIIA